MVLLSAKNMSPEAMSNSTACHGPSNAASRASQAAMSIASRGVERHWRARSISKRMYRIPRGTSWAKDRECVGGNYRPTAVAPGSDDVTGEGSVQAFQEPRGVNLSLDSAPNQADNRRTRRRGEAPGYRWRSGGGTDRATGRRW